MSLNNSLQETVIPKALGQIIDIAPIDHESSSVWLVLAEDGSLIRLEASTGEWAKLATAILPPEVQGDSYAGHGLSRRLYASRKGEFAAVVNDYGHFGQVIDLRSGQVTLNLHGGADCSETVPFSFAFAEWQGQIVAIHRSDWNRLDVSDASTGQLLTARTPTSYKQGEERPQHYLDYFHGALYLSPQGTHILDDGWVWHPVGIPVVWNLDHWLSENVWESEDGPTKKDICARVYYWDHAVAWIDEETIALGGIGDDDSKMIDGARIFNITQTGSAGPEWRSDWLWARELRAFAGPAGKFFCDGKWLYSSDKSGFSRWNLQSGERTGFIAGFTPSHQHRGTSELVQIADGMLLRWSMTE